MNPALNKLQPYPFERLRALLASAQPPAQLPLIPLYIGEPRHAPPPFVLEALTRNMEGFGSYPLTAGLPQLRASIARWLTRRFQLPKDSVSPETMILPVNGTREALFAFVQAMADPSKQPLLVMPNPFYQIYEGAAFLAGAEPYFMPMHAAGGLAPLLPDLDAVPAEVWQRCQVLFLCSPSNPTGAVASIEYMRRALQLAERHDFVIASDECYSEIYFDEAQPPVGLLQAAIASGNTAYERCIVFHSLSKRSSLPGLRSGFVAGDAKLMKQFLLYRTYHGSAMPQPTQMASIAAWDDETHVAQNRELYRQKFAAVLPILREVMDVDMPDAAFYLWPRVGDGERFTRELFERQHITVLPGSYIARNMPEGNPGHDRVRISLVATVPECIEAAHRIRDFVRSTGK
jgi:N-succinyldiaminopimelate aminotransferase